LRKLGVSLFVGQEVKRLSYMKAEEFARKFFEASGSFDSQTI
jgi:hypothetical protein